MLRKWRRSVGPFPRRQARRGVFPRSIRRSGGFGRSAATKRPPRSSWSIFPSANRCTSAAMWSTDLTSHRSIPCWISISGKRPARRWERFTIIRCGPPTTPNARSPAIPRRRKSPCKSTIRRCLAIWLPKSRKVESRSRRPSPGRKTNSRAISANRNRAGGLPRRGAAVSRNGFFCQRSFGLRRQYRLSPLLLIPLHSVRLAFAGSAGRNHIAVGGIAALGAIGEIRRFDFRKTVLAPGLQLGVQINPIKPCRVKPEDRGFYRPVGRAERRKAELLLHIFRNFKPAERLDLPLRGSVPNRIRSPKHVIV